ncbi:MAG: metallophosphoesterase [Hyphomicrobium sp.]
MQIVPDPTPPIEQPEDIPARGKEIIDRLRRGELPQMVDWFDPGLLAKVGVRSVISATLGQYTDQRLIQAATDNESEQALAARYDYSGTNAARDALQTEKDGAVWVDYIADLGDGFEATYAMAYLLAADGIKVAEEPNLLPAGKLLIMGGDQVYPDATKQEYESRLRDPYDWAFTTENPQRKVFAIPGNHDWYDGLSAFSALFCSARDRISGGIGTQLGGWRCHQHRSYFAIKLPHNWWIWGPDIQLADNLDDSQRDYFDLMADQTKPGDTIILCLAEPSWLHKNYDNMHEISMLARKRGAKICAVLAGDWHHYSRYTNDKLGTQFITSGGGGAFAHATHGLKSHIDLKWATPTGAGSRVSSPDDTTDFNRSEKNVIGPEGPDFTQHQLDISAEAPSRKDFIPLSSIPKTASDLASTIGRRVRAVRRGEVKSDAYVCHAPHIYPPRWKSRMLCLKNLFLPFRNRGFTALVGIIYFIYAWAYVTADPRQSPILRKVKDSIAVEASNAGETITYIDQRIKELTAKKQSLTARTDTTAAKEISSVDGDIAAAEETLKGAKDELRQIHDRQKALMDEDEKLQFDTFVTNAQKVVDDSDLSAAGKLGHLATAMVSYAVADLLSPKALVAASEQSPFFAFLLLGLWSLLIAYVESESRIVKVLIGTIHFTAHLITLLVVSWIATSSSVPVKLLGTSLLGTGITSVAGDIIRIGWSLLLTFFIGGALGGFVMGLYWTLTSTLLNMHSGDAFGALGIKDYKHFLRIKLEPGRATVYAIALDKVPGRRGWRWKLDKDEVQPSHCPQILPIKPLVPRLIEPPIIIDAQKVRA